MQTFGTVTTADGLEFKLSEGLYRSALKQFQEKGVVYIQGNTITKSDFPKFRVNQKKDLPLLAQSVFSIPNHHRQWNLKVLTLHAKWMVKHPSKPLRFSLIRAVRNFVHSTMDVAYHWDAEYVFQLIDSNYAYLSHLNRDAKRVPIRSHELMNQAAHDTLPNNPNGTVGFCWEQRDFPELKISFSPFPSS